MKQEIAKRLKAYRKLKGLSQKQLAELAGLSVTTVNHIEQGCDATLSTMDKIEEALGASLL